MVSETSFEQLFHYIPLVNPTTSSLYDDVDFTATLLMVRNKPYDKDSSEHGSYEH